MKKLFSVYLLCNLTFSDWSEENTFWNQAHATFNHCRLAVKFIVQNPLSLWSSFLLNSVLNVRKFLTGNKIENWIISENFQRFFSIRKWDTTPRFKVNLLKFKGTNYKYSIANQIWLLKKFVIFEANILSTSFSMLKDFQ